MKQFHFHKIAACLSIALSLSAFRAVANTLATADLCFSLKSYLNEIHHRKNNIQQEIQSTREQIRDYESTVFVSSLAPGGVTAAVAMAAVNPLVGIAALGVGTVVGMDQDCAEEDLTHTQHQLQKMQLPLRSIDQKYIQQDQRQYVAALEESKKTRDLYRQPVPVGKNIVSLGFAESKRLRLYLENQEQELASILQREKLLRISFRRNCQQ